MRRTMLPVLALLPLALAACGQSTASQPKVSAFAEGTCRVAAPDVLAIGHAGARLGRSAMVDRSVLTDLRDAQTGLRTVTEGAEPAYKKVFDQLVVSTGFVRIRADGNSYDPTLGKQLMADYDAVVRVCTAGA